LRWHDVHIHNFRPVRHASVPSHTGQMNRPATATPPDKPGNRHR
jgi:hypothetical protein